MKKMKKKKNDSPVSWITVKLMKIQRTNLTSLEPRSERSSPCYKIIRNSVLFEMWFLTIDSFVGNTRFHRKAFRTTILLTCWSMTFIVKNISNSLTYTFASSCVYTSPLAIMTVVGLHDFVKSDRGFPDPRPSSSQGATCGGAFEGVRRVPCPVFEEVGRGAKGSGEDQGEVEQIERGGFCETSDVRTTTRPRSRGQSVASRTRRGEGRGIRRGTSTSPAEGGASQGHRSYPPHHAGVVGADELQTAGVAGHSAVRWFPGTRCSS